MWLNKTLDVCASQFFQKRGVSEAMSIYELFNAVSGLNIPIGAEDEFIAEVNTHRERESWIYLELVSGEWCRALWQIVALEKRNEDHVQRRGKKSFPVASEDRGPP